MSEAVQPPDFPSPGKRPPGITARQWRLAAVYPRCKTAYEACVLAGYKPSGVNGNAHTYIVSKGTQLAKAYQDATKLDSARSINGITAAKLRQRIQDDSASDQLILGAYKITGEAIVAGVDDVETVSEADRQDANSYIKAIVERILVATGIDPYTTSTQQLIDNTLVAGPASDNSQYVNCASPQSTTLLLPESGVTIEAHTVANNSEDAPATRPAKRGRRA